MSLTTSLHQKPQCYKIYTWAHSFACTDFDAGTNWSIPLQCFAKGDLSYTEHTQTTQKLSCVHFHFLRSSIQHLTSLNLTKILDCRSPIESGKYPCSFFQGCSSVMSKCFTNTLQFIQSLIGLQDEKALSSPSRSWKQRRLQEATEKHSRSARMRSMGAHRCSCASVHISRLYWPLPEMGGDSHCSSFTAYFLHQKAQCRQPKYESTHLSWLQPRHVLGCA